MVIFSENTDFSLKKLLFFHLNWVKLRPIISWKKLGFAIIFTKLSFKFFPNLKKKLILLLRTTTNIFKTKTDNKKSNLFR